MSTRPTSSYVHNDRLFAPSYFERVLENPALPAGYALPSDAEDRLEALRSMWRQQRQTFIRDGRTSGKLPTRRYIGLPEFFAPTSRASESDIENGFIRPVCEKVLGYAAAQNRPLVLRDDAIESSNPTQRPDLVLFADHAAFESVIAHYGEQAKGSPPDAVAFCRSAALIVDAKRFNKGVGADESDDQTPKRKRTEPTAIEDVQQVGRYLRGADVRWGVLTNGRSWRLMRQGKDHEHVRFDLVRFLEDLGEEPIDDAALRVFGFFWHLFGPPGSAGGYLDALERESEANNRRVREVLRNQAHAAVETIARGFWYCSDNGRAGPATLTVAPQLPDQAELDHLREVSLTLLYRLLFVLKAEAQDLLPLRNETGASTLYARRRSSAAVFAAIESTPPADRCRVSDGYQSLQALFDDIDRGSSQYGVPAYNGGLFNGDKHTELSHWLLLDDALYDVLLKLIYIDGDIKNPVPYADLDVRDLGDIYEGLLEQRLTAVPSDPPSLHLRNEKGERKASGSYFTRDDLVDHLVRRALQPLLDEADGDPERILDLRVLDPAMGSGHFLVKVVDVMADHLTVHCDPADPEAPRDNGPAERAYWKRTVVEQCVYGVDYNPMAVELARVALWLHTAEYGRPLSFLDHHLKVGNSLVGASLDRLSTPGLKSKSTRTRTKWVAVAPPEPDEIHTDEPKRKKRKKKGVPSAQLALPFQIDTGLLSGILKSIHQILDRPSQSAEDVKRKSQAYAQQVDRQLAAHRLLADLWCLQWFVGEPSEELIEAYESPTGLYARVKEACGVQVDAERDRLIAELSQHPLVQRVQKARSEGYGPRMEAFFHWELAFPEVAFDSKGKRTSGFGFDAVVGNPPWDRIRPERRQYYGAWGKPDRGPEWDVANTQASSLDDLINRLHAEHPSLADGWVAYERDIKDLNRFLRDGGAYEHQVVKLDGRKTGGDPDTFRFFVERGFHAVRTGGRVALVVPSTLWQAQGCTGLRRLLLLDCTLRELFVFENYRKWAFDIDSRFKFTTFVAERTQPAEGHDFPAAFMLRDLRVLHGQLPERLVRMSPTLAETLSPGTLAMLDLASDGDAQLMNRLQATHPSLGGPGDGWGASYRCELHMTNDAWRFKSRAWMRERGFVCFMPTRSPDGVWEQHRSDGSPTASYPEARAGGEFWMSADADWYRARGYKELEPNGDTSERPYFVHPDDTERRRVRGVDPTEVYRIVPSATYRALYEGRMVHNFDHAQKRYDSGEGRRAAWSDLPFEEKRLIPRRFVAISNDDDINSPRVGFCDVTGATNERTTLATVLPPGHAAGNKVPTLRVNNHSTALVLASVLNSFVWDWAIRFRVSTTMNWTYVSRVALPSLGGISSDDATQIAQAAARLCCTTPEMREVWQAIFPEDEWSYTSAERSPKERANLRAQIDATIADLYGLTVFDYARILTGFPLLDRSQPALKRDRFVTDANADKPSGVEGRDWEETEFGVYELKPRSFVTRDLALLTFMRRKGVAPPQDLHAFYKDKVGINPNGPMSRFRIGKERDLIDRVDLAEKAGAVAYVPG